ncbi:murein L,D-transpeptidase catalytic domain family protein [Luteimonas terrae]|uniref:Murein L,D-transpeptidase catalytic domain family protein n=1 Tax=Luteimonas terrae TaxID=1530191 RepID=A0A4R5U5W1_9GAMM|nr:murein L,D-transpeptidase catalytic domain family protein [Luteimonas terrae]TDK29444.1 murein L,D-transpeptidase catalytic domain family protein [Luteimonas terrae]
MSLRLPGLLLVIALLAPPLARADDLLSRLSALAPALDRKVLAMALQARDCAARDREVGPRLAVIDYARPSTEVRLWVFDVDGRRLLHAEHVAHGRGSGGNVPTVFSDVEGSYQSSLGLFAMAETYTGQNGYSLRMDGLEPGINARARERLIVMHGADYVDPAQARRQGRLGRSWGCPAVRSAVAREVIDDLKDGQLLFAYADDPAWLRTSTFLHCPAR